MLGSITNAETAINEWAIPISAPAPTGDTYNSPYPYTPERFEDALFAIGVELRHNLRSQRQQFRRIPFAGESTPSPWMDLTDNDSAIIRAKMAVQGVRVWIVDKATGKDAYTRKRIEKADAPHIIRTLEMSKREFIEAAELACAMNPVDPFLEYLENDLPRWDGIPRVSAWLWHCFDLADESIDLADWASEFLLIGSIQRAYHPACKLDETPVLIGPPGIGKSTAPRKLFPPELEELFTDGLNLGSDTKTRVEALQGRAIVEIGEMAGARRADVESLKAFLSRTDDGSVRLTWRRNPEPLPRRCIIVGTADRDDPLPPDHNLRRFVPVRFTGGDVGALIAFLDQWRGQLWAEALELYQNGQDARLPDWLKPQQQEATDKARPTDSIQDSIERWLVDAPDSFTLEAVAHGIRLIIQADEGAKVTPADQQRIGTALRHFGYQKSRRRVNGRQQNVYSK